MTRIKICGLSRPCDVDYVNAAMPDYCGFVVNFPKSRRSVTPEQVRALRPRLFKEIAPVGVFVDRPVEEVAALLNDGTLSAAQLHGCEDDGYLAALRRLTDAPLIQAFRVASPADAARACESRADFVLLDSGQGSGRTFDWSQIEGVTRPFFLAGGLSPENLREAVARVHPFAVDLSSGVETGGLKDRAKILSAVHAVHYPELSGTQKG